MSDYEYVDADGKPIAVGDRIKIEGIEFTNKFDEGKAYSNVGRIISISDPDVVDGDYGIPKSAPPICQVIYDDGDGESFTGHWTATGPWDDSHAPFMFEDFRLET